MGRRASIKPNRSIYSVEELTELYKKEKNTRMQKRLLAVKMMLEEDDISSYDVASRLSTSPTSIRDWVNKYNQGGYEALKGKGPRGGKPRISDEEFLKIIEEIPLGTSQWTLERIAVLTQQRHKDGIKKSAVWYRLRKMGIHGRVAGHTIPRQTKRSKKHLKKRG
jgi:transposase